MRTREGRQIFVDALTRFAEQSRDPRLTPIIRRVAAPVRVDVRGRDGVGHASVAAALAAAGVTVSADESTADVTVVVIAEAPKPEDIAFVRATRTPTVVVLNKADLAGTMALAHRRAAEYCALTGVPVVPMVALLATVDLDDELTHALYALARAPADLSSTDAFVSCEHALPGELRRRLLDTLDRFGIAQAVAAVGDATGRAGLSALLRRLSHVDGVVACVDAAGAPVRYRRLLSVITELRCLAAQSSNDGLVAFLATDDTVLGVMSAAVDVVGAAGVSVDRGDDPAMHLRRAVQWRRYGRGPVNALHRRASADICRGSLRLLGHKR